MKELIKKILRESEEELENSNLEELPKYTDPSKGVVAPSQKVISDVCEKEKFCKKQGPITFGQLRSLVESAQKKNLTYDIGEGFYKAILRLFPWFFPQIAVAGFIGSATRAFNKIIRPGLEDTRGYKSWWGKTIMTVMDYVEGDIPHTDPISKIFFISDGLLHMMDRKFKLKFARYIAELAASKPDSEPVPEYFVENELRNWINQKFLLNPPLSPKTINEGKKVKDDWDWVRKIKPASYEDPLGKALEFNPPITDSDTLTKVLNYLVNIGFEHAEGFENMDLDEEGIIGLYINPGGRIIWTADWIDEDYQDHINEYAEKDVKILDGWITLDWLIGGSTINESEDDTWGWVRDVEIKSDLTPAQILYRYGSFPVEVVGPYIAGQFRDIEYRNGRLFFITDGWCDFVEMFEDNGGGYNYMNSYLAKAVLCGDDYWEPYSSIDLIGREWVSNVWDLVTDEPKALEYVKNYIREGDYIGQELEDGEIFTEDMLLDDDLMGTLIDNEEVFDDLKRELGWTYASSYNNAVSNSIYNTATDSIIDLFGEPTWEGEKLVFDATDLILSTIEKKISDCWDDNKRYYDPERHKEEDQTDEEGFETFAEECIDKPFDDTSWFLNLYSEFLKENGNELGPHYDDYVTNSEMKEYFLDDLQGRI